MKVRPDHGTLRRAPAFQRRSRPNTVVSHVNAGDKPSQNMLISAFTSVVLGITAESMLCVCRSWWKRMPSTNPPSPMPSSRPALIRGPRFIVLRRRPPVVHDGGYAIEDNERQRGYE